MKTIKFKVYKVGGVTVVGIWVDGVFEHELDTCSELSVSEAKAALRDQYSNK